MPVVPCAQLTTGQPCFGGLPRGSITNPDTPIALPRRLVER